MDNSNHTIAKVTPDQVADCAMFEYYMAILMAVCAASCLIGNILSLLTFGRQAAQAGTSPTIFLLQAMAFADMLVLIPVIFVTVYPGFCFVNTDLSGVCEFYIAQYLSYMVKYFWPFSPIGQMASAWLTVTVTFHRYRAVCLPLSCHSYQPMKRVYIQVAIVWLFSTLYNIPRFFEYDVEPMNSFDNKTYYAHIYSDMYYNRVYQIVYKNVSYLLLMNIVPVTLLLVLTSRLVKTLKKAEVLQSQIRAAPQLRVTSQRLRRERSLTFTLVVVVVVFVFCQTPTVINRMLLFIFSDPVCGTWMFYFTQIANLMIIIHSSINFYIYSSCSSAFRYHLKKMLTCGGRSCSCCRTKKPVFRKRGVGRRRRFSGTSNYGFESELPLDQTRQSVVSLCLIRQEEYFCHQASIATISDTDCGNMDNSVTETSLNTICTRL